MNSVLALSVTVMLAATGCRKPPQSGPPNFRKLCETSLTKLRRCMPGDIPDTRHKDAIGWCAARIRRIFREDRPFFDTMISCYDLEDCEKMHACIKKHARKVKEYRH